MAKKATSMRAKEREKNNYANVKDSDIPHAQLLQLTYSGNAHKKTF